MNQDTLDDLKQFITAAVLQGTIELSQRLENLENRSEYMESRFDTLERKVDRLTKDVVIIKADLHDLTRTVYTIAVAHTETLEDHGRQLAKLHSRTV